MLYFNILQSYYIILVTEERDVISVLGGEGLDPSVTNLHLK